MARIAIEAHSVARHFMGEQLEELERELQAQGHTVSFREPIEERGLPTAVAGVPGRALPR
jgi:hypothetical protein